ncbi:MAG TPA: hypothetical protein VEL79_02085 [Vicinamibacterales bacterium]|nr:hypothetical protein [Vicinamibacterales bacterium]
MLRDPSLVPVGRKAEYEALLSEVERVRQEIEKLRVLSGLDLRQQMEVAGEVLQIDSEYQEWRVAGPRLPRLKALSKRGAAHIRTLARKLGHARRALANVANHATKLDRDIEERIGPPIRQALRAVFVAEAALTGPRETVDEYTARMRGRHEQAIRHVAAGSGTKRREPPRPVLSRNRILHLR